jgi:hypothetical protein
VEIKMMATFHIETHWIFRSHPLLQRSEVFVVEKTWKKSICYVYLGTATCIWHVYKTTNKEDRKN